MAALDAPPLPDGSDLRFGQGVQPKVPEIDNDRESKVFGAAFRQSNSLFSLMHAIRNSGLYAPEEGYNPIDDIKAWNDDKYLRDHVMEFTGSYSRAETQAIKSRIDAELKDKELLAANGGLGFVAGLVAGMTDPTILLPGGVAVNASKGGLVFLKAARNVALAGAAQTAVQEAVLHGTQETRTLEESALNVATATLLSGLIGGGAAAMLSRAERQAMERLLHADRAEINAHADNPPNPEVMPADDVAGTGVAQAAGAAASDTRQVELVESGLNRVMRPTSPMQRLFGSEAVSARRAAADLAETPLLTKENLEGGTTTTGGPALSREALLHFNQTIPKVGDEMSRLFSEYRFGEDVRVPRARAFFQDVTGRAEPGKMSFAEFKENIADALRDGDQHAIPQVQAAAQFIRNNVFNPWLKRAQDAGMLGDVDVKTAESYFQRVYNKEVIASRRPEFVDKVTDWLHADQATKAQAKERIAFANAQLRSWSKEIEKFEGRLETLNDRMLQVGARLDEKARDLTRAEDRTDVLTDRAASIAEEIREVKQFVAEARSDLRDPELLQRLDALEAEANALRKAEQPMSEKDLQRIEDEELKGVLTGPTRRAAEILTGRRKPVKQPTLLEWIAAKGGVKRGSNWATEFSEIIDDPAKLRKLSPKEGGKTLHELADDLVDDFPNARGVGEVDPGRNAPTAQQLLNWIEESARGNEQHWVAMDHPRGPDFIATQEAAILEEIFSRAGVEVKTPRDVAKVLAGERVEGIGPADLDKIAADLEASGETIPLSLRRADVDEQLTVTREQVQAIRDRIAKGMEARASRERRLELATARGEETAMFERQARGRLGILEDRMSLAERRRELMEDAIAIAHRQRDEVRAKIEKEIAAWEGKSVSEAKSALKAREKAMVGRAADEPRLQAADKAVDRAVRRILESDRDLSVDELRSRADQITDRILGSPDGRLPYDIAQGGPEVGVTGGEPPRGPLASREFNIPDATIRDFLDNDVEHVIGQHLRTVVPDVLLTEKFGDTRMTEAFRKINDEYAALSGAAKSEKDRLRLDNQRKAVIADLAAVRDRIRGVYAISSTGPMRNAARAAGVVKNFNVLTSMGSAALSSLPDMAGTVFRHGMTNVFGDAWAPFFKFMTGNSDAWKEAARQYRAMGIAVDMTTSARHHALSDTIDNYHPQSRVERTMQWATDKFQYVNLLAPWTDFAKVNASLVAGSEILRAAAASAKGTATARQVRMLGEANITPRMAERIQAAFETGGEVRDGVHLPNTADWADAEARRVFEGAVAREADIAVITPGQEKPLTMSDPLLSVFTQFKSFIAAANERILMSNLQRRDAQVLQGLVMSLALGMLSYKINSLTGGQPTSDRPQDWFKEAISRSGMLGWMEEGNALAAKATSGGVDIHRLYGADKPLSRYASRSASDQLLGPTKGKIDSLFQIARGATNPSEWNESDSKAIRRLVAGQNVVYLRRLFDQVEAAGNNAFGIEMKPRTENR